MNFLYILALGGIALITIALFVLMGIGFVQAFREKPEELPYGESLLFPSSEDADEVFYDIWGIKQGYSKTDANGNKQYYDAFGTQIGRSERRF